MTNIKKAPRHASTKGKILLFYYTTLKPTCKRGIVTLAIWGLIPSRVAIAILKALEVRHV